VGHPGPFHEKRIRRRTERQLQKRSVKKQQTKAQLRREFDAQVHELVARLRKFARVRGLPERERHLRAAIEMLERLLEEKPQSDLLRAQREHCLEALKEMLADPERADSIDLEIPLAEPDGIRLVLRARIHPPASDRKSWN
jgi:hypothetical protein